ncbi:protein of unknown function [Streptomyces murinus]
MHELPGLLLYRAPTGIVHFPPAEQDRMQGWPWVFSELRPRRHGSGLCTAPGKSARHQPLNDTPNTLDITHHLTTYLVPVYRL